MQLTPQAQLHHSRPKAMSQNIRQSAVVEQVAENSPGETPTRLHSKLTKPQLVAQSGVLGHIVFAVQSMQTKLTPRVPILSCQKHF